MWTDGRYHLQASKEMDENWILMKVRQFLGINLFS